MGESLPVLDIDRWTVLARNMGLLHTMRDAVCRAATLLISASSVFTATLKENAEKVKMNKQLPYLVANVVEASVYEYIYICVNVSK